MVDFNRPDAFMSPVDDADMFGMFDLLINGDGRITQRAAGTVADGAYGLFDRHYHLNQSNPTTPSQLTDVADGTPFMMRLTQSNASAQRFGLAQVIEAKNCKKFRGRKRTLGLRLRTSDARTVRFAILGWTSTADNPTKDVVADWTSGTFTAGNFFLASNVAVYATGSIALAANTLTDVSLLATLGSTFNNLYVMVWTDATAAQNVTLDIAWELLPGDRTKHNRLQHVRSITQEMTECLRYYWQMNGVAAYDPVICNGQARNATLFQGVIQYPVPMRKLPTFSASNSTNLFGISTAGDFNANTVGTANIGLTQATLNASSSGMTAGQAALLQFGANATTSTFISFDAELGV